MDEAAAAAAPADRPDDASWRRLAGRSGEVGTFSPMYRMSLGGPTPEGVAAFASDVRPPDRARGEAILRGEWRFGAARVSTPPDRAPWGPEFPSLHFADRIHRLHWLRDVARLGPDGERRARALALSWLDTFGRSDGFGRVEAFAWRPGVTADRLINLFSSGPWLTGPLEKPARDRVLDSLARQARHLAAALADRSDPAAEFRMAAALTVAGAALDDGAHVAAGLAAVEAAAATHILPDGGHASRSPEALAEALIDLHMVEELLLRRGLPAPAALSRLQARMATMLSFLRCADGRLLVAHGGGEGGGLAVAALAPHGEAAARFSFARLTGYQRVEAGELRLFLDTAAGPAGALGGRSHASALAFAFEDGPDRVVTECGAHADLEPHLREAARRTAAHATLAVGEEDSAPFVLQEETGLRYPDGPSAISARRLEEGDELLLEGQHGGWRVRHGLIHRRRIYVARSGAQITGEDALSRPASETGPAAAAPVAFALRFHLHPDVQLAPGEDDRTVFLGLPQHRRVWRFRSEAPVAVEDSRYWGGGAARRTAQLVVRGAADPAADGSEPPNRVRWAFTRVEPAA
jgi:uncharacterized heparinase superfamily protein